MFVAKSRAAPGLDKVAEDEARGRHIVIAWFEIVSVSGDSTRTCHIKVATLGEISITAGYHPTTGVNDTARDVA